MFLPKTNGLFFSYLKHDIVFYSRILNQFTFNITAKACYSDSSRSTTSLKRGTGGRSSFSGVVATVFGATGFLGKYVVNELGKIGSQIIIPYRGTAYAVKELRVMGDLGQVLFMPLKVDDDESIRKAIKYSNVVINLIGKDNETKHFSHQHVHVDIAARIARISKEMGVEKLIHLSALNANPIVPEFIKKGGSTFLKTKGIGELEVLREFPKAIIFRPSDMYGHQDRFFYYLVRWERRRFMGTISYIPIWKYGKNSFKQPVAGQDVAKGIINVVTDPTISETIIEAVGPHRYRFDHLVWWLYMVLRYSPEKIKICNMDPLLKLQVKIMETIKPIYPIVCLDKLERECFTDTLNETLPTLEDVGIENLTNLEDRLFYEVRFRRENLYYWDSIGEFATISPPPRAVI